MKQEKIDFIRNYYKLQEEVEDIEISSGLYGSLGAVIYDIKQSKKDFIKAFASNASCLKHSIKL